jgi:hypothetical protein
VKSHEDSEIVEVMSEPERQGDGVAILATEQTVHRGEYRRAVDLDSLADWRRRAAETDAKPPVNKGSRRHIW